MKKIVECVPNFSEGRNTRTIEAIAAAIRNTSGCRLLDVDPGSSTNRTVFTFVGTPEAVGEGALNAAHVARERIDMRQHTGEHPRMGALDVCPFIPVANVTMQECVEIANTFARRAADKLQVPFYLYEAAAQKDYRKTLSQIREGEYEGLEEKMKQAKWQPDFGPNHFVPEWGASITGARQFLIAYNVNILGTSNQAHRIALNILTSGRGPEEPGILKNISGIGWFVDEYNLAQVTLNISDYHTTPLHLVYETVKKEAAALKVGVAGSEIVGLIPLDALRGAADHYIEKEKLFILDEDQKVRLASDRLGLHAVRSFEPEKKIIEYRVAEPPVEPLAGISVRAFIEKVSARSTTPGGGSAAALMTALGAALGAMAAKLTYGVRKFEAVDDKIRCIIPILHDISNSLIPMIDQDAEAYQAYAAAMRLPAHSSAEKERQSTAMKQALADAIGVPMRMMRAADDAWEAMCDVARYANIASMSDIQAGAKALEAGIWAGYQNILINTTDLEDDTVKQQTLREAARLTRRSEIKLKEILTILENRNQ